MTGQLAFLLRQLVGLIVLVLMFSSAARAESISGLVTDSQGGVLPGVTVTIQNVDTGVTRTAVTGSAGRYDATSLPPGTYSVSASLTGFTTVVRRGVTLTVGRDIVVDMKLEVGEIADEIVVIAEAPLVDTTSGAVSGLVDERSIRDLPLVARSWDKLINLQPGAGQFRPIAGDALMGFGEKFTVSGQRFTSNSFYQDGVELGGAQRITGLPGSAAGVNLGVEAIREFRVLTSSYSPEYGKKTGGAIITVTKSGTNSLHGSVLEFYRNDALDAANFFAVRDKDPFTRHNFGGSLGGPLVQNRSFFFVNYEGLRERLATPFSALVPNALAREGILPGPGGTQTVVGVAPEIRPFLSLWPLPNARDFGDGTAAFEHAPTRRANEGYFLGRFDHQFSDANSVFVSYSISDAEVGSPMENPLFLETTGTREQRVAIEHKTILSTRTLNTVRLGFHRSAYFLDTSGINDLSQLGLPEFIPGAGMGNIAVTGLVAGGPGTQGAAYGVRNSFQFGNHISHVRDKHTFEAGGQLHRYQINEDATDRKNGQWEFDSLRQFLLGQYRLYAGAFPEETTGRLASGPPLDINYNKAWRQTYLAFYIRDRYRVKPNLTFDLGLRYEVLTSPTEIHGRVANNLVAEVQAPLFRRMSTEPVIGQKVWETDFMKGFAPRLGVAWDPFSKGKTSVQGGFGVFYDQIEHDFRFFTHINAPFAPRAETALRGAFPVPWGIVQFTDLVPRGRSVDPNIDVPTVLHYNVGVEQQVGGAAMFRVGYVGAKGTNLLNVVETNLRIPELVNGQLFWSATAPVAEPRLGTWDLLMSEGTSRYDALQAEFQTRFAEKGALGRLRTKASYTFSKSTDIISGLQSTAGTNSRAKALDPFDLERDRGLSSHHVAHAFSWNFTYDLSGLPLTGIAGALATGWQVSGIWSVTDGVPINIENGIRQSRNGANTNVERPDLIAGGNDNPVLGGHITYFDATQFTLPAIGTLGNLGRNTLIGPGLSTFDLSLGRNIPIRQFSLQFRAEIFNIFNRANLGLPDRSLFTGAGVRRGAAGRITATSTQARQVQLGLKLVF